VFHYFIQYKLLYDLLVIPEKIQDTKRVNHKAYIFVFIYVHYYLTRFQYQMMFVSLNSNTTGVTSGAGTVNLPGAPVFTLGF
jgi:hypothetical protein